MAPSEEISGFALLAGVFGDRREWLLEARSGIEPLYTALQAAA